MLPADRFREIILNGKPNVSASINVFDLFAGPGGLGEGFSGFNTLSDDGLRFPFNIVMSVEMEKHAHQTLMLRAFIRQFRGAGLPVEYYKYLQGDSEITKQKLFELYPCEYKAAKRETLYRPMQLGDAADDEVVFNRLAEINKASKDNPTIVIGGPPCQAYSLVGRSRNMGNKNYDATNDKRHTLYQEYLKVIADVKPDVFIMENVRGILSASLDGDKIFPKILNDLKLPGSDENATYRIYSLSSTPDYWDSSGNPVYESTDSYLIRCEKYGIPQSRHRVILLGVRSDIARYPSVLSEVDTPVSVEQIIGDLPALRSVLSREIDSDACWTQAIDEISKDLIDNLKGEGHNSIAKFIKKTAKVARKRTSEGARFVSASINNKAPSELPVCADLQSWILDSGMTGHTNHEARAHMREDIKRYIFCAAFAEVNAQSERISPKAEDIPAFLAPKHLNWNTGYFNDRFRVQARNKPSNTVTSHLSKDGHYFIHYDPSQCRSLTVREAARIQTFPDNYFFEGPRTRQFIQVGNAVPPYLAQQIAQIVHKLLA